MIKRDTGWSLLASRTRVGDVPQGAGVAGEVLVRSCREELGPGGGTLVGEPTVSVVQEELHRRGAGGLGGACR